MTRLPAKPTNVSTEDGTVAARKWVAGRLRFEQLLRSLERDEATPSS